MTIGRQIERTNIPRRIFLAAVSAVALLYYAYWTASQIFYIFRSGIPSAEGINVPSVLALLGNLILTVSALMLTVLFCSAPYRKSADTLFPVIVLSACAGCAVRAVYYIVRSIYLNGIGIGITGITPPDGYVSIIKDVLLVGVFMTVAVLYFKHSISGSVRIHCAVFIIAVIALALIAYTFFNITMSENLVSAYTFGALDLADNIMYIALASYLLIDARGEKTVNGDS